MATWEQKMPPLHHDASSSLWSIKSSTPADVWPPAEAAGGLESPEASLEQPISQPASRSFMDTLSSRHLFPSTSTSSEMEPGIKALSQGEFQLQSSYGQQQQQSSSSLGPVGGGVAGAAAGASGPCKSESTESQAGTKSATSPSGRLLNGPASVGGSTTKVTKKRARASRKPPTTVLEADSANFRAMVQQLTGIPAVPLTFLSPSAAGRGGLEFLNLVRPPPARSFLGQGLPPLSNPSFHFAASPLSRGQGRGQAQLLHSDPAFAVPYSKSMFVRSQDQSRQASIGDFLRTPMEELSQELGLDRGTNSSLLEQQPRRTMQPQHLQPAPAKLSGPGAGTSMPVLWDGSDVREADGPLPMDPLTKFKLGRSAGGGADAEEADVDSWLDQNAEAR